MAGHSGKEGPSRERLVKEIASVPRFPASSLLSATHVSLPEIDDGAVEIRRAPHLHRHVLAATIAAVREGEREVVRGACARREGCSRERRTLLDGFESQGTKKAILGDRNVPIYKVFPGYFPHKMSD